MTILELLAAGVTSPEAFKEYGYSLADVARVIVEMARKATNFVPEEKLESFSTFIENWNPNNHSYSENDRLKDEGVIYKVLIAHTSQPDWKPAATPSLYARVLKPEDPNEIPEWQIPDNTNPWMKGDKVSHNGHIWISNVDNNIWEPGASGVHTWDIFEE